MSEPFELVHLDTSVRNEFSINMEPHSTQTIWTTPVPSADDARCSPDLAENCERNIDLVLIGWSGNGKSATANSLLDKPAFQVSTNASSESVSKPMKESCVIKGRTVSIVDGLKIGEHGADNITDISRDIESLRQALQLTGNGFHTLVIVLQFGIRFSKNEAAALNIVKSILGENVIKEYGICVMTHGDNVQHILEEEKLESFKEWCRQQEGDIKALLDECSHRCVLFDNKTKCSKEREAQVDEFYDVVSKLSTDEKKRYTMKDFEKQITKFQNTLTVKKKQSEITQATEAFLEQIRLRLKSIDTTSESNDAARLELQEMLKEIFNWCHTQKEVLESQECHLKVQALHMEIESRLKNVCNVEDSHLLSTSLVDKHSPSFSRFEHITGGSVSGGQFMDELNACGSVNDNLTHVTHCHVQDPYAKKMIGKDVDQNHTERSIPLTDNAEYHSRNKILEQDLSDNVSPSGIAALEAIFEKLEHRLTRNDREIRRIENLMMECLQEDLEHFKLMVQVIIHDEVETRYWQLRCIDFENELKTRISRNEHANDQQKNFSQTKKLESEGCELRAKISQVSNENGQLKQAEQAKKLTLEGNEPEATISKTYDENHQLKQETQTNKLELERNQLQIKIGQVWDESRQMEQVSQASKMKCEEPHQVSSDDKNTASRLTELCMHDSKSKDPLTKPDSDNIHLFLIGNSGNGKSATGNSITNRAAFQVSSSASGKSDLSNASITKETVEIGGKQVHVIDGPSLADSGNIQPEDVDKIIGKIQLSLELCKYTFNALLITLKFGQRYTKQETETIKLIKSILGKNVIRDYGICVITHGDNFEAAVEEAKEEGENMTFDGWLKEQGGDVRNLFEECNFRVVLFDNKTKDAGKRKDQFDKLMAMLPQGKEYSREEFFQAAVGQQELALEASLPLLQSQTQMLLENIREDMKKIEKEHLQDPETYMSRMQSLISVLRDHKQYLEKFGSSSTDVGSIVCLLSVSELEIVSKIKVAEMKLSVSQATSSVPALEPRSETQSANQSPAAITESEVLDFISKVNSGIEHGEKTLSMGSHEVQMLLYFYNVQKLRKRVESLGHTSGLHTSILAKLDQLQEGITTRIDNIQDIRFKQGSEHSFIKQLGFGQENYVRKDDEISAHNPSLNNQISAILYDPDMNYSVNQFDGVSREGSATHSSAGDAGINYPSSQLESVSREGSATQSSGGYAGINYPRGQPESVSREGSATQSSGGYAGINYPRGQPESVIREGSATQSSGGYAGINYPRGQPESESREGSATQSSGGYVGINYPRGQPESVSREGSATSSDSLNLGDIIRGRVANWFHSYRNTN